MRIPLNDITAASKCFRYHNFLKKSTLASIPSAPDIALSTIKKCYVRGSETGHRATWRAIVGWVDKDVFRPIDVTDKEAFKKGKKIAERILSFLSKWYNKIYLKENVSIFTNVPIEGEVNRDVIYSVVPIVKVEETPVIVVVSDVATKRRELYNRIDIRALQWMLSEHLNVDTVAVNHLWIGPDGAMKKTTLYADEEAHTRTKSSIGQIASLIRMGADWPSVTDMCKSCPFVQRCKL